LKRVSEAEGGALAIAADHRITDRAQRRRRAARPLLPGLVRLRTILLRTAALEDPGAAR
jgi:hypothetical protein